MAEHKESTRNAQSEAAPVAHDEVLGYLLKHVHLALQQASDEALAELDITSRDLGVIRVVARGAAMSQQEISALLRVDRTSMVSLIDALERKALVERRPAEDDRRRNVVVLTTAGRELYLVAERRAAAVDQKFLSPLSESDARAFRRSLQRLEVAARGHQAPPATPS